MLKDQATENVIPGPLNLFEKPIVQKAVLAGFDTEILPINYQNMNDEIEFVVGPSDNFIDPSDIYLSLRVAIENNARNVTLSDDEKIAMDAGPVNGLFYAMFDRVELQLNDTPLIFSYRDYGYKGWFHTELNYSKFAKESFLRSVLWERDLAKSIDDTCLTVGVCENTGLARYQITGNEKTFELSGRILHELFFLDQYVLPRVQFKIKLIKKNSSFCLMSGATNPDFKLIIKEAKLHVHHIKVDPEIVSQIERRLTTTPAVYTLYNCTQIISRSILPGAKVYTFDNFFMNKPTPSRLILALVDHDAYIGNYQKNPFSFVNAGLDEASVIIDQQAQTYRIDSEGKNYLQVYTALSTQLGNKNFSTDLSIEYNDFLSSFFLLAWDLTPTRSTT